MTTAVSDWSEKGDEGCENTDSEPTPRAIISMPGNEPVNNDSINVPVMEETIKLSDQNPRKGTQCEQASGNTHTYVNDLNAEDVDIKTQGDVKQDKHAHHENESDKCSEVTNIKKSYAEVLSSNKDTKNGRVVINEPHSLNKDDRNLETDEHVASRQRNEHNVPDGEQQGQRDKSARATIDTGEMDTENKNADEKENSSTRNCKSEYSNDRDVPAHDHANEDQQREAAIAKLRQYPTYDTDEDTTPTIETGHASNRSHGGRCEPAEEAGFFEAKKKYEYFWKNKDICSQWHSSWFTVDGVDFENAEKYMMYSKAKLFGDDNIARKMLGMKNPSKLKALGRKVKQFREDVWNYHRLHVVKTGNIAKFSQNRPLKEELFSTYPKVLVEASPLDAVWGIGLDKHNPLAWDESTWEGENLLGYIITEVRDELMADDGVIEHTHKQVHLTRLMKKDYGSSVDNYEGQSSHDTDLGMTTANPAVTESSGASGHGENISATGDNNENMEKDKSQLMEDSPYSEIRSDGQQEHVPNNDNKPINCNNEDNSQLTDEPEKESCSNDCEI